MLPAIRKAMTMASVLVSIANTSGLETRGAEF